MQSEFVFSCSEERITETTSKARLYASFANFSLSDFSDWSCSDFDKSEDGHESIDLLLMDDLVVRRMVRFGSVRVRTHKVTLGDNPSCSKGAPLSLAWDPMASDRFCSLEEFELVSGAASSPKPLQRVSVQVRQQWLQNNGHSLESIEKVVREIETVKQERLQSRRVKRNRQRDQRKNQTHPAVRPAQGLAGDSKFRNNDDDLLAPPRLPQRHL